MKEVKGIDLVIGSESKDQPIPSERGISFNNTSEDEKIPSNLWAIIAFCAAIVGLGVFMLKEKREAYIGTVAGITGTGSLLMLQYVVKKTIEAKSEGAPITLEFQFAFWGALIAMGIAGYICYLRLQKGKNATVKATPQTSNEQVTNAQLQVEPIAPSSQENSFDTNEWVKRNKVAVVGLLLAGIAGFGLYYFVLRNDPITDGKNVSIEKCKCVEEFYRTNINKLQDFNQKFDSYKFKSRQTASATLDSLLQDTHKNYEKSIHKTDSLYEKNKEKYVDDKDQIEKFEYAFNAQNELCKPDQQKMLFDELRKLAEKKINMIVGLTEFSDRILANQYGSRYRVLTDSNSGFEKYEMDQFILPERKNNENYPYITEGDFNGDKWVDRAVLVQDRFENRFLLVRLAIIWGDDQTVEIYDESCSAISLVKGDGIVKGFENDSVFIKYDAIGVECFEKSSWVLYWDGSSFQKIWTSD